MDLAINSTIDGDRRTVLEVVGSVDLQSRTALIEASHAFLRSDSSGPLVLDLSGVTFLDSTGIGSIVQLSRDSDDVGRGFAIRNPSPRVVRILELTGLLHEWTVESAG